jgi:uncharacterized protein YbjQ (UPF0145 family)
VRTHRLLMTTTSVLDGWEVLEYLGPVSAQFVIGTGLFTDFVSGITDFFGMHSGAYQQKLDRINTQAIDEIARRAQTAGANAVVGMRIDHDEVSGGGKSMLMVTASGTAARVRRTRESSTSQGAGVYSMPGAAVRLEQRKQSLRAKLEAGRLDWNDPGTWDFVLDHMAGEAAGPLLDRAVKVVESGWEGELEHAKGQVLALLPQLPDPLLSSVIYDRLRGEPEVVRFLLEVMKEVDALDLALTEELVERDDLRARRIGLNTLAAQKRHYSLEDADLMERLSIRLEGRFPIAETRESGGVLGRKAKWTCECGSAQGEDQERCRSCARDRRGFLPNDIGPEAAIRLLQVRARIVREGLR